MFGLDYLGGAKYRDLILREHPAGWAAGFFCNTFGNAWPAIDALLATGRCPRVRVHALWTNHTYDPKRDDRKILAELARANQRKERFPDLDIQFSHVCEHAIKGAQLRALVTKIEKHARADIRLVNSVWTGDPVPEWINEVHGAHAERPSWLWEDYNYSFDGSSAVDSDVKAIQTRHERAETFYYWHPAMNGKLKVDDTTPIAEREAWPTSDLIDSLIYLHRPKGGFPELPGKWIFKSHADRHETPPEPRAYKPVLICPVKAQRFEMVADNGQVVAVSGPMGTYTDGRPLYRFGAMGFEIAEKARRIQGHSVVALRAGSKLYGRINPAFRAGEYR